MRTFFLLIALSTALIVQAQDKISRADYIAQWSKVAMDNMRDYGIPASITLAQACLESADGNSDLARRGKNHFGIKCHGWDGKKIYHDDDKKRECFRKYKNAEQSFQDHSTFLSERSRYAFLFELKPDDYKAWAKGLKKAGYATNPKYPALLIKIIEDNNLQSFDEQVMKSGGKKKKKHKVKDAEVLAEQKDEEPKSEPENVSIDVENDDKSEKRAEVIKEKKSDEKAKAEETSAEIDVTIGKQIQLHENNVKYVVASSGDTPEKIANELELGLWQIVKYNDVDKNWTFNEGDVVFIQPKRNRAKVNIHKVSAGETLWEISQRYAISLKKLQEYNAINAQSKLSDGDRLFLKKP